MNWEYIGDGVYAAYDGFHVWITLNPEFDKRFAITLEPTVMKKLFNFMSKKQAEGSENEISL